MYILSKLVHFSTYKSLPTHGYEHTHTTKAKVYKVKIARGENHEEVNCHPHALSCSFASSTLYFLFSR